MDSNNLLKRIKGKRYVCMSRCSGDPQIDTSIPAQLDEIRKIGKANGGIPAGNDIILPAISGSKPGNRTDIQDAIERKIEFDDFDIILTLAEDRFTRGGSAHGIWAEYEFIRNGIEVIHVKSDIPDGPHAHILRGLKFDAARETAKSTGLRSSMEYQRSLEANKICTSSHTPYGLYRIYLSSLGTPLFIIRDNRNGTQDKLHYETRQVLERFGTIGGKGGRFKKQKLDRVFMVLGDEHELAAICLIMRRRWIEGIGGSRTSKELNALGITAPYGGKWTQRQVDVIAENSIYCGVGEAGHHHNGGFVKRVKGGPVPVEVNPTILATKKTLPVHQNTPEEYTRREEPNLQNFLPQPLRDIALANITALWERRGRGEVREMTRNTHLDSLYLLTGLFWASQDKERPLVGQNCGPKGHMTRYYAHPIARKDPVKAGFPNTTFRAEILENALLEVLAEILTSADSLRAEVRVAVEAAISARKPVKPYDLGQLQQELDAVAAQIKVAYEVASPDTVDESKNQIAALGKKRRQLEEQVRQAKETATGAPLDAEAIVESILVRLKDLPSQLRTLPVYALRQLLAALTDSLTADMHTRQVTMALRVPPMAIIDTKKGISDLCLQSTSGSSTSFQTQNEPAAVIAHIDCEFSRQAQKQCFKCRRRAA